MKHEAAPPLVVRIGAMDYAVRPWSVAEAKRARCLGLCDPLQLTILLREDMVPLKTAEVLMHEVLHAAYDSAGLSGHGDGDSEERIVLGLGYQMLQVWRDNPDLVRYFEEVFRPPAAGKAWGGVEKPARVAA